MYDQAVERDRRFAKVAVVAACAVMILLVLAEIFADPNSPRLSAVSRGLHLLAVSAMCWTVLVHSRFPAAILLAIAAAAICKALDSEELFRFAYITIVCWLFAAAGYCAAAFARPQIDTTILWLLFVSTVVALGQVLGIHESLFLWSRHGVTESGKEAVTLLPTFLRETAELMHLTLYQTRPSSIFPSNQLYTGFLLFASAAVLMLKGRKAWIGALLVGAGVALSSAKAALIGVPLTAMICLAFMPNLRRQALVLIASSLGFAYAYTLAFPGLVSMAVSYNGLFRSILVRGLDLMTAAENAVGIKDSATAAFIERLDFTLHPDKYTAAEAPNVGWKALGELNRALADGDGLGLSEPTGLGWKSRAEVTVLLLRARCRM